MRPAYFRPWRGRQSFGSPCINQVWKKIWLVGLGSHPKQGSRIYAIYYMLQKALAKYHLILNFVEWLSTCHAQLNVTCAYKKSVYNSSSTACTANTTHLFLPTDNSLRCGLPRGDWEYSEPQEYSIITWFDINCDKYWLVHLTSSMVFVGWGVASPFIGNRLKNPEMINKSDSSSSQYLIVSTYLLKVF